MRILHTSDWHFGKTAPVIGDYGRDQRFFLEQLKNIIVRNNVDAVLCCGDIYDFANVGAEAIDLYNTAVTDICLVLGKPMAIIAGNHDSAERLSACRELLEKAKLYIRGRIENPVRPLLLDGGKTAVYMLPFFHPAEIAAKWHDDSVRTMPQAVRTVLDSIRAEWDPSRRNILMAHLAVSGSELSESDRTAANSGSADGHVIGGSASVETALFEGFDYVALGHIHKPQTMAENVCYCGSPVVYSFGREENQQKGVRIYDTETGESGFIPVEPLRGRLSLACTYNEALARDDLRDVYLNLTLTDRVLNVELSNSLTRRFPYLMELRGQRPETGGGRVQSIETGDALNPVPLNILNGFMKDIWNTTPDADLAAMFIDLLEAAEKEDKE